MCFSAVGVRQGAWVSRAGGHDGFLNLSSSKGRRGIAVARHSARISFFAQGRGLAGGMESERFHLAGHMTSKERFNRLQACLRFSLAQTENHTGPGFRPSRRSLFHSAEINDATQRSPSRCDTHPACHETASSAPRPQKHSSPPQDHCKKHLQDRILPQPRGHNMTPAPTRLPPPPP